MNKLLTINYLTKEMSKLPYESTPSRLIGPLEDEEKCYFVPNVFLMHVCARTCLCTCV